MGYFLTYLYTHYVFDWVKSLEIVSSFLKLKEVKGYSYNVYAGGTEPIPHIAVRFNFEKDDEGKKAVEAIIEDLVNKKLVIARTDWESFTVMPSVERATEVSTKCAFAFKNWMNSHTEMLGYYVGNPQNRVEVMSRFLAMMLSQLGFKTSFEDYPIPDKTEAIRDCARECSNQIKQDFDKPIDIVFMERIIHHFLNCVHITFNEEPQIYGQIAHWEWLNKLIENRKTVN